MTKIMRWTCQKDDQALAGNSTSEGLSDDSVVSMLSLESPYLHASQALSSTSLPTAEDNHDVGHRPPETSETTIVIHSYYACSYTHLSMACPELVASGQLDFVSEALIFAYYEGLYYYSFQLSGFAFWMRLSDSSSYRVYNISLT